MCILIAAGSFLEYCFSRKQNQWYLELIVYNPQFLGRFEARLQIVAGAART